MSALRATTHQVAARLSARQLHAAPIARAAVAPAVASTSSAPRTSAAPIKKAAVARKPPTLVKTSAPSLLSSSRSTTVGPAASNPSPSVVDDPYDFADFPTASAEPSIDDYASLSRPAAPSAKKISSSNFDGPTPSPPLSSLPSSRDYSSLPSAPPKFSSTGGEAVTMASGENGIAGEVAAPALFHGLSEKPFDKETIEALLKPIHPDDVEVKPDGLLYLPEIKYRRTLNAAFGPGGWGMAPRGETNVGDRIVSREWGLVCLGRLVSIARGEQEYFDKSGIPTATEACKSNALMRCCKDLGIASELWDPRYIREFKDKHCAEVFVEHATKKSKRKLWRKKAGPKFEYPWKET